MTMPVTPPPDTKDWTWVLERECPQCGFAGAGKDEIAPRVRATTRFWRDRLQQPDVKDRPSPDVWSPLEYACHVRDVTNVMDGRLAAMLAEDGAHFDSWDQDATAVESAYFRQDPASVAVEYEQGAEAIAQAFEQVSGDQWQRRGLRSNGSEFTVETLGVYMLHDLEHHVWDVSPHHDPS